MRRIPSIIVAVLGCAVLLTGCLRTEIGVEVDGSGSGRVRIDLYVPTVELRRLGISEAMLDTVSSGLGEAAAGAGADVDVSTVATADEQGISMSYSFKNVSQVQATMTGRDPNAAMIRMFDTFDIHKGPDGAWVFQGTVAPQAVNDTFAALGRMLEQSTGSGRSLAVDPADVGVTLSVKLPGEVATTNSTDVDGGLARWVIKGDGAAVDLSMRNSPAPFDPVPMVVGATIVSVVVFVMVLFIRRRRRRRLDPATVGDWSQIRGVSGGVSGWQPPPEAAHGWGPPTGVVPAPGPPQPGPLPPPYVPPPGPVPGGPPAGSVPLGGIDAPGDSERR